MPRPTNPTPITAVAYFALLSIQRVAYSETMPTSTNTVMKPVETAADTNRARRTVAR